MFPRTFVVACLLTDQRTESLREKEELVTRKEKSNLNAEYLFNSQMMITVDDDYIPEITFN